MKKVILLLTTVFAISLMASDGAGIFVKCAGCHGDKAQKKALNRSEVIAGWPKEKLIDAIKGYKDGTYGGAMKGVMKGRVASLNDKDIEKVSQYISSLK
jgi:cytochrome c553